MKRGRPVEPEDVIKCFRAINGSSVVGVFALVRFMIRNRGHDASHIHACIRQLVADGVFRHALVSDSIAFTSEGALHFDFDPSGVLPGQDRARYDNHFSQGVWPLGPDEPQRDAFAERMRKRRNG